MALGVVAFSLFDEIDQFLAAAAGSESTRHREGPDAGPDKHMTGLAFHLDNARGAVL